MTGVPAHGHRLEHRVARVLTVGTLLGVAALAAGVVAMAVAGRAPFAGGAPTFAADRLLADLVSVRAEGLIWLGLVTLIATPAARVAVSLIGFAATRDRAMAMVAAAILAVIALGVVVGKAAA